MVTCNFLLEYFGLTGSARYAALNGTNPALLVPCCSPAQHGGSSTYPFPYGNKARSWALFAPRSPLPAPRPTLPGTQLAAFRNIDLALKAQRLLAILFGLALVVKW